MRCWTRQVLYGVLIHTGSGAGLPIIQAIIDLPLQIDTSDTEAMERGLRYYNGKPMLNSVNGKRESMESVFPIAKKYGAVLVCLCLDEGGITLPSSAHWKDLQYRHSDHCASPW